MGDEFAIVDNLVDDDQKEFVVANAIAGEENVVGNKMRRSIIIEVVVVFVLGILVLFVNNIAVASVCVADEATAAVMEKSSSSKSCADRISILYLVCSRP